MMAEPVISALSLHFAPLKIQKPRHNATGGNPGDRNGAGSEKQFSDWRPLRWTLRGGQPLKSAGAGGSAATVWPLLSLVVKVAGLCGAGLWRL